MNGRVRHAIDIFQPTPEDRPGNACGAYHAAVEILERRLPDEIDGFARDFKERTGCTTCRTIRKHRLAECRECVIAAARFLDRVL